MMFVVLLWTIHCLCTVLLQIFTTPVCISHLAQVVLDLFAILMFPYYNASIQKVCNVYNMDPANCTSQEGTYKCLVCEDPTSCAEVTDENGVPLNQAQCANAQVCITNDGSFANLTGNTVCNQV
jgi:hypothetical protein